MPEEVMPKNIPACNLETNLIHSASRQLQNRLMYAGLYTSV